MTPTRSVLDQSASQSGVADSSPSPSAGRGRLKAALANLMGIGLFLVVIVVYFSARTSLFLTSSNLITLLSNASVLGTVALGQAFAIISGGFDLSVGGTLPLISVLFVRISNAGVPTPVAILVSIGIGGVIGVINGLLIERAHINPLIATLGTMSVGIGAAYSFSSGTTIEMKHPTAGVLADNITGQVPYYLLIFIGLAVVAAFVLRMTTYGRMLFAIGGNREASRLAGIRVRLVGGSVYVVSGMLAGLAGVITSSELLAGSPTVGSTAALESVAAVVLGGAAITGGVGSILGTVGGILVLGCLANGLALEHIQPFYEQMVTGAALLVAVVFSQARSALLDRY